MGCLHRTVSWGKGPDLSSPKHVAESNGRKWLRMPKVHVPRPPTWLLVVLGGLFLLLGGTAAAAYGYDKATDDRILPGVSIAGIDVSGMTRKQALDAIQHKAQVAISKDVTVHAADKDWTMSLSTMGVAVHPMRAVDQAFEVSGGFSWMSRVYNRLTHHEVDENIPLSFTYHKQPVRNFVKSVARPETDVKAHNAEFTLEGDDLVIRHSQQGQALRPQASIDLLVQSLQKRDLDVTLPVDTVEPAVTESTLGETLTVNLSTNTLQLYNGLDVVRTYGVATATYGFTTPIGEWHIVNKVENPTWYNPCIGQPGCWAAGEPASIPPGPGNPLGTRALYLDASGIRIHGTPSDSSIGTYASHGCIRMHISESEALYPLVPIGTKVIIFGAPPWGNQNFDGVVGT